MNIVFASSEVAPFAKTGGLADVCGALPVELHRAGHNVAVIDAGLPAGEGRRAADRAAGREVRHSDRQQDRPRPAAAGRRCRARTCRFSSSSRTTISTGRSCIAHKGEDYKDNCERFVFFCRAALESIRLLHLQVDVIHCHDWQTALIPAYLHIEYAHTHGYENIASLLTIHNLAYQGIFWHWDMLLTGLDWKYFNWHQMEFYGKLNLLKTGIVFADWLTTVSPTYAKEIQTDPLGCGLEGVLRQRQRAADGHRQRRRLQRVEPGDRPASADAIRRVELAGGQGGLQGGPAARAGPARSAADADRRSGRPAGRPKGLGPGGRGAAPLGDRDGRAVGDPGHRRAVLSRRAGPAGPRVSQPRSRPGWNSAIRWPTGSRRGPTSS